MSNLTTSSRILGLAELGEYQSFNAKIPQTNYKGSNLKTSELATIILAIVVFTGGLATAFCVVCVRYKRWEINHTKTHKRNIYKHSHYTKQTPFQKPKKKKTPIDLEYRILSS